MESTFSAFVWAYMLKHDEKVCGISIPARLEMYTEYHNWSEEFVQEIKDELQKM